MGSALAGLMAVAALAPLEQLVGASRINLAAPLAIVLCAIWTAKIAVRRQPELWQWTIPSGASVAVIMTATLAFVLGQYPWFSVPPAPMTAQLGGLMLFVVSALLFLITAHELRSLAQLRTVTWTFVVTGSVVVAVEATRVPVPEPLARVLALDSVGSMFWTWFAAICCSQSLFNRELSLPKRALLAALTIAGLLRGVVFAFSWVSGWLPPLLAVMVLLTMRFPRTMACAAFLAVAPSLFFGQQALAQAAAGESYSSLTRFEALKVLRLLIEQSPLFGFGPANYYHYTSLFSILGWYVAFSSHDQYIDLVAQTGFVGLAAFLWFALAIGMRAWHLRRVGAGGFSHAYVRGACAGLVASLAAGLLGDWLIPFTYNVGIRGFRSSLLFWVFLGGVIALDRFIREDVVLHGRVRLA